jgi:hypothetical protein
LMRVNLVEVTQALNEKHPNHRAREPGFGVFLI